MKVIVFLGGYARAGKSTAISLLRELGYPCFSTSEHLYEVAAHVLSVISGSPPELCLQMLKNYPPDFVIAELGTSKREFLKDLAEKAIVPTIGRYLGIVHPVMSKALTQKRSVVFVESIGGEEQKLQEQFILESSDLTLEHNVFGINIRRHSEQPGVDIRQLVSSRVYPVLEIENNQDPEALEKKLRKVINQIRHCCCI